MTRTDSSINNNKDGSTSANTASKFVIKDIVLKKKNPQQRLEKYFEIKKKTRSNQPNKKNFQGFPLAQCRYEEEIGDFVYCPPCYSKKKDEGEKLCHECLLRPCIVRGKWNEIMDFCEEVMIFENDDSEAMYFKMLNHAESILVEIFGADYVTKQQRAPGCLYELVGNYHRVKGGMELDDGLQEGDPDEELVANAIDAGEYNPHP